MSDNRTISMPYLDYRAELKKEFNKGQREGYHIGFKKAIELVEGFYYSLDRIKKIEGFDKVPRHIQVMLQNMKGKGNIVEKVK